MVPPLAAFYLVQILLFGFGDLASFLSVSPEMLIISHVVLANRFSLVT